MQKRQTTGQGLSNRHNPTKLTREQLRNNAPRVNSPRQSARPVERSGQRRTH